MGINQINIPKLKYFIGHMPSKSEYKIESAKINHVVRIPSTKQIIPNYSTTKFFLHAANIEILKLMYVAWEFLFIESWIKTCLSAQ